MKIVKFKIRHKFKCIKRNTRLKFLISKLKLNKPDISLSEQSKNRGFFNLYKNDTFTITEESQCYICSKKAEIRHHVVPISKGGTNKFNNIVFLCHKCHCEVHPHMRKGYKPDIRNSYKSALCKPKQEIVVISPIDKNIL